MKPHALRCGPPFVLPVTFAPRASPQAVPWPHELASRPLLYLGISLAIGANAGLAWRPAAWAPGDASAAELVLALALSWIVFLVARRASRSGTLAWVLLILLLGFLHGATHAPRARETPPSGSAPVPPAHVGAGLDEVPRIRDDDAQRAREGVLAGRWRSLGTRIGRQGGAGGRGWVEPVPGVSSAPSAAELLLDCELFSPDEGDWVVVLPGAEAVPLPRGPVDGPRRRRSRFLFESRVRAAELIVFPGPSPGGCASGVQRLWTSMETLRANLSRRAAALESSGSGRGLVAALLLGDRSEVDGATLDSFTRTGTRHLLALSGLHVGLVVGALLLPITGLLLRLPLRGRARLRLRRVVMGLRLALLFLYMLVAGMADPVTRAGATLAVATLAPFLRGRGAASWERGRLPDALSVWGAVLMLEILVDPRALESVSLRLSYLATLGILLGTRPLGALLLQPFRGPRTTREENSRLGLPGGGVRHGVALIASRGARLFVSGVAASIAAMLATFPETAARFGEWSPIGILATPLLVPLLTLLLVTGWIGILTPFTVFDPVPAFLAEQLVSWVAAFDALPGTPAVIPPRPSWLLAGMTVGCFAWLLRRSSARPSSALSRKWVPEGLTRLSLAAVLLPWSPTPAGFELHLLDVGHGTCAVARAPGLEALVFDAGSRSRHNIHGEALGPLLASWEVNHPWVALSHDHRDHSSGLDRMLERTPPRGWIGALPRNSPGFLDPTVGASRKGRDWLHLDPASGRTRLRLGSLEVHVIRGIERAGNEGSRSLELRWRGQSCLLSGDAEAEGLAAALSAGWVRGPLRLLLFPHHGSDTDQLSRLLEVTQPEEIWISADGVPSVGPELTRRGLAWKSTEEAGPLSLLLAP